MNRRSVLLLPAVLAAALLWAPQQSAAGAGPAPREESAPPADFALAGDAKRGAGLFRDHCATCHGAGGRGDGLLAGHLDPPPGDLTRRERMDSRSDWHLYRVIRDGGRAMKLSPVMPAFGERLTDQELHDLTVFTRALSTRPPT
ncbi:MAG TPA: c-type cytochrome [Thermoanaerobaculia bacterium]|nr:c-type cytochrome [Thermoanaerobaculia bacterium]